MIRIDVPATSANLGAGFDSLGIALTMQNRVWMEESDSLEITCTAVSYTHLDVYKRQEYYGPVYIRLGRLAVESCNNNDDYKFEIGKGITLRDGKDITVIASGLMVGEAVKAVKALEADGIDVRLIDMHTIKPLDRELVLKAAQETGRIVTVEEHNVIGGLGEAVASYLSEACPTPVIKIGVNDVFGHSGPAVDLLKEFGLSAENIEATVKKALGK